VRPVSRHNSKRLRSCMPLSLFVDLEQIKMLDVFWSRPIDCKSEQLLPACKSRSATLSMLPGRSGDANRRVLIAQSPDRDAPSGAGGATLRLLSTGGHALARGWRLPAGRQGQAGERVRQLT
jgi:hypothetical protein